MFALDRDIAQIEPSVFRDITWVGQLAARGTATVNGTMLEASAVTPAFTDSGIELGHVVVVGGQSLEVIDVLSENFLEVAMLREGVEARIIPPVDIVSSPFHVMTFRPQLEWVHRQVLAMLGLAPAAVNDGVLLPETSIKNPWEFVRVEVFGALHVIYAAAGAALAADHAINQRSAMYKQLFREERLRVVAQIDTDGDGQADVLRRMNVGQLVRG
ncbi:MAG: hypothetical protein U0640_09425 [Phycisphaerales bacterium]